MSSPADGQSARAFPVTYEQEAIWLEDSMDPSSSIYLVSWVCKLRGAVDTGAVEWAVRQIVARHPALHSGIEFDGERIVQIEREDHAVDVERLGRPDLPLEAALEELAQRPMDLRVSPVRVTLLEMAPDDVVLLIQLHHVVVDDWSMAILEREFQEFYCARVEDRAVLLDPLPLLPGEHAAAQRSAGITPSVVTYWRERLQGAPLESTVPAEQPSPSRRGNQGGLMQFQIDAALGDGVRAMARHSRTTPFTVLSAGVTLLLCAYNGSSDQVLGTIVSRRGSAGVDQMITCLAGILPMRQRVRTEEGLGALVAATKQVVTGVVAHRDIPFSVILKELKWPRNYSRPPMCQVVLVVDDVPRCSLELPGVRTERLYVHTGIALADIVLSLLEDGDGYRGLLVYASDLYRRETAQQMAADFCALLAAGIAKPDLALTDIIASVMARPLIRRRDNTEGAGLPTLSSQEGYTRPVTSMRALYARFRTLIHESARFSVVGLTSLAITDGTADLLRFWAGMDRISSAALATLLGTSVAFVGSRYWTYRHRERTGLGRETALFFGVNGIGLVISEIPVALTYPLRLDSGLSYNIAVNGGITLACGFRYWSYRKWVWRPAATPAGTCRAAAGNLVPLLVVPDSGVKGVATRGRRRLARRGTAPAGSARIWPRPASSHRICQCVLPG